MNPIIRIAVIAAALAGAWLIGRALSPAVATNLTARKSWTRTEGEVRAMNGAIEFEIGREPSAYRAFATVEHTWGLRLFKKVPLFVDPADPSRIKPAGLLQMWLAPAGMSGLILLLLAIALIAARLGTGPTVAQTDAPHAQVQWMFTESPGPLGGGIILHSPTKQWKIVLGWSILGVALAIIPLLNQGGSQVARLASTTLGAAFALSLWGFAWHTKTMEISANSQGIRMTSVMGWRDVPWGLIRSMEDQDIFTTYYNGNTRMWELPFPGSTVRVFALNDQRGRTLMSFSPELEPKGAIAQLFALCTQQTGLKLQKRTIAIRY
jgi:hypothetical protein